MWIEILAEKFEIYQHFEGKFRFRLISPNGDIVFTSGPYGTKDSCKQGIESAKKWSQTALVEDDTLV